MSRLEEIKNIWDWDKANPLEAMSIDDLQWLIQQAERVEELEQENERLHHEKLVAVEQIDIKQIRIDQLKKKLDDDWEYSKEKTETIGEIVSMCHKYKQAMSAASEELYYVLNSSKSNDVKKHYVTNAKRYLDEALADTND